MASASFLLPLGTMASRCWPEISAGICFFCLVFPTNFVQLYLFMALLFFYLLYLTFTQHDCVRPHACWILYRTETSSYLGVRRCCSAGENRTTTAQTIVSVSSPCRWVN